MAQGPPSGLCSLLLSGFLLSSHGAGGGNSSLASRSHLEVMICSTAVKAITICFYKDLYPEVLKMTSAEDFDFVSIAYGGIKS